MQSSSTPRQVLAWDSETARFRPGRMAPPLACISYFDGATAGLLHWTEARDWLGEKLYDPNILHVGQNLAYDLRVVCENFPELTPLVWRAYDEDRITDTAMRQELIDISKGCHYSFIQVANQIIKASYSLDDLAYRHLGKRLEKLFHLSCFAEKYGPALEDLVCEKQTPCAHCRRPIFKGDPAASWRLVYGTLRDLPLADWPQGARDYPVEDARVPYDVFHVQEEKAAPGVLEDQFRQARKDWWLGLTACWGLRTSPSGVRSLKEGSRQDFEETKARLITWGLVREKNGTRDTKAAKARMIQACEELGRPTRLTVTGQKKVKLEPHRTEEFHREYVSLDSEACDASEDPVLEDYAKFGGFTYVWSKDIPALERGMVMPIHTRFGRAATGRVTSSKPNVQNWRRLPGVRECFVPRAGWVFIQADYDQLELRTLAQLCFSLFGHSALLEALNAGRDPHLEVAAAILRIPIEEAYARRAATEAGVDDKELDNARQTAKVANFGFPGGLGAPKLCLFAKKSYNVDLAEDEAKRLKRTWLATWPEMRLYFAFVSSITDKTLGATIRHLFSNRIRGGATYTAACNSGFQGLGADATGRAGYLISRECYRVVESPLFGSRPVNYIHDEFHVETREGSGQDAAARRVATLMVQGAREFLPNVEPRTKPCLMRYWSKAAKAVVDDVGLLIPWEGPCDAMAQDKKGRMKQCGKPVWFVDDRGQRFCQAHASDTARPIRPDGVIGRAA